jgi:DNA-binding transcriptional MerR regulator
MILPRGSTGVGTGHGKGCSDYKVKGLMETTRHFSIGTLASRSGVTAETIRYYEREGVLPSARRGGAGGYRRYDEADLKRLRFVRRARDLGFALDDVRALLDLAEGDPHRRCGDVNSVAHKHLRDVEDRIARLTVLRAQLQGLVNACDADVEVASCSLLNALGGDS